MTDAQLRELIRQRMAGPGAYFSCDASTLARALELASPGDTISVHPVALDGRPTLYELGSDGQLRELALSFPDGS